MTILCLKSISTVNHAFFKRPDEKTNDLKIMIEERFVYHFEFRRMMLVKGGVRQDVLFS